LDETSSFFGKGLFDRAAIALSGLCLVHCVTTVIVVSVLASAGGMLLDPMIHEIGLGLAILLAAIGLGRGVMLHRQPLPAVLGLAGLSFMAAGLAVPHGGQELAITVVGVGLVALAHTLNRRALA
jgi:hypothetical protein